MTVRTPFLMIFAALAACASPVQGEWELEVVDADDCEMVVALDRQGDDVEGDAELDCLLYEAYYDEWVAVRYDDDDGEVEGELDGDDVELDVEFADSHIAFTLEGDIDGDEMSGDVLIDGEFWAEFEGRREGGL